MARPLAGLVLLLASACKSPQTTLDRPALWPFPSHHLIKDGAVSIDATLLPSATTPFDTERLRHRSGFSPVQTAVIAPSARIDPSTLPTPTATSGSVQLWDLDAGAPIPALVEVDAYPELADEVPTLLVRPVEPMAPGHQVAVAVTGEVHDEAGDSLSFAWYDAAVDGRGTGLLAGSHYADLDDTLGDLGVSDIVLAFDFVVGDGTGPMRSMAEQRALPEAWTWDSIDDADEGVNLPDGTWMRLEGSFTTTQFLGDDGRLVFADDGAVMPQGNVDAPLYVHVPDSVRDAEPGTVPVWLFGHGIFRDPGAYLSDLDDEDHFVDLADRAGAILVGTEWRGLSYADLPVAVGVGGDLGTIDGLTDLLAQGVANTLSLAALLREGDLLDDPALMGLPRKSPALYFGVSLGAIEGATVIALDPDIDAAVLHVGGSTWSTMLERSSNWPVFEELVIDGMESACERQLAFALTQLYWDPADPALYTADLQGRTVLWQEAIGDDQVPNLTLETLLRGVDAPVVEPAVAVPNGLASASLPVEGPALTQFDPERPLPADENRPAEVTDAHYQPRKWDGMKTQVIRYLDPDDPGVIEHYCGDAPCSESNQGSP